MDDAEDCVDVVERAESLPFTLAVAAVDRSGMGSANEGMARDCSCCCCCCCGDCKEEGSCCCGDAPSSASFAPEASGGSTNMSMSVSGSFARINEGIRPSACASIDMTD